MEENGGMNERKEPDGASVESPRRLDSSVRILEKRRHLLMFRWKKSESRDPRGRPTVNSSGTTKKFGWDFNEKSKENGKEMAGFIFRGWDRMKNHRTERVEDFTEFFLLKSFYRRFQSTSSFFIDETSSTRFGRVKMRGWSQLDFFSIISTGKRQEGRGREQKGPRRRRDESNEWNHRVGQVELRRNL